MLGIRSDTEHTGGTGTIVTTAVWNEIDRSIRPPPGNHRPLDFGTI